MKKYLPGLILWITSVVLSIFIFQNLVLYPNSVMTTTGHDGMKNYFSALYYIRYDSGIHFSGMNYPFGENILYTDNMPLFSYATRRMTTWIPGLKPYTLGIMHLFLFASVPVSAYFIFKILRRFRTGVVYAIIAALFMGLIHSPGNSFYYVNNFDRHNDKARFADKGMFVPGIANGETVVSFTVPEKARGKEYTISLWAQCNLTDYRTPYFEVFQYDKEHRQTALNDFAAKQSTNVRGNWFLAEGGFTINANTSYIKIRVYSNRKKISYSGLDNLLIQPRHSVHYYRSNHQGLLLNNRPQ